MLFCKLYFTNPRQRYNKKITYASAGADTYVFYKENRQKASIIPPGANFSTHSR